MLKKSKIVQVIDRINKHKVYIGCKDSTNVTSIHQILLKLVHKIIIRKNPILCSVINYKHFTIVYVSI